MIAHQIFLTGILFAVAAVFIRKVAGDSEVPDWFKVVVMFVLFASLGMAFTSALILIWQP
jgi:hypothetical protein